MKIRERIRKDLAMLRSLEGESRRHFIWDYYKIPIILIGSLALITVLSLWLGAGKKDVAMYAVFVNSEAMLREADQEPLDRLLERAGVDMEGKSIDLDATMTLGSDMSGSDGQTIQVLAALFGISGLDLFGADEEVFLRYAQQDAFVDLSLFLEKDLLENFDGELFYHENSEGRTILAGLVFTGDSLLHTSGYYSGPVVLGAAASAENLEEAVAFLRQALLEQQIRK